MKTYKVTIDRFGCQRWHNEKDQFHREDGPAVVYKNSRKYWFINGKRLTEQEFNNRTKPCFGKIVVVDGVKYTLT